MILPVVVELDDVDVTSSWKFCCHVLQILVLHEREHKLVRLMTATNILVHFQSRYQSQVDWKRRLSIGLFRYKRI